MENIVTTGANKFISTTKKQGAVKNTFTAPCRRKGKKYYSKLSKERAI